MAARGIAKHDHLHPPKALQCALWIALLLVVSSVAQTCDTNSTTIAPKETLVRLTVGCSSVSQVFSLVGYGATLVRVLVGTVITGFQPASPFVAGELLGQPSILLAVTAMYRLRNASSNETTGNGIELPLPTYSGAAFSHLMRQLVVSTAEDEQIGLQLMIAVVCNAGLFHIVGFAEWILLRLFGERCGRPHGQIHPVTPTLICGYFAQTMFFTCIAVGLHVTKRDLVTASALFSCCCCSLLLLAWAIYFSVGSVLRLTSIGATPLSKHPLAGSVTYVPWLRILKRGSVSPRYAPSTPRDIILWPATITAVAGLVRSLLFGVVVVYDVRSRVLLDEQGYSSSDDARVVNGALIFAALVSLVELCLIGLYGFRTVHMMRYWSGREGVPASWMLSSIILILFWGLGCLCNGLAAVTLSKGSPHDGYDAMDLARIENVEVFADVCFALATTILAVDVVLHVAGSSSKGECASSHVQPMLRGDESEELVEVGQDGNQRPPPTPPQRALCATQSPVWARRVPGVEECIRNSSFRGILKSSAKCCLGCCRNKGAYPSVVVNHHVDTESPTAGHAARDDLTPMLNASFDTTSPIGDIVPLELPERYRAKPPPRDPTPPQTNPPPAHRTSRVTFFINGVRADDPGATDEDSGSMKRFSSFTRATVTPPPLTPVNHAVANGGFHDNAAVDQSDL